MRELLIAERGGFTRVLLLSMFGALLGLAMPYASMVAIDIALPDASPRMLLAAAIGVVLLVAYQAWNGWLHSLAEVALSSAVERGALLQVFSAVVRSEYAALRRQRSGSMTTTLSSAGIAIRSYIDNLVALTTHGASAIGYFIVLGNSSMTVAAMVVLAELVLAVLSINFATLEAVQTRVMLERGAEQQQLLHSLLSGLNSLRGLFAVERQGAAYSRSVEQVGELSLRVARNHALQSVLSAIGSHGVSTGLMVWSVLQCFNGQLSLGGMMFLISACGSLSEAIKSLVGIFCSFRGLRPHVERVDEVLAASTAVRTEKAMWTSPDIVIDKVFFRYSKESRWVCQDQSLVIRKGELFCLESPSGSGKTTLLRMIAGLLQPTRGKVSVFGVDASRAHEVVLYVPQHCTLFEATIRENLELLSGVSFAKAMEVAPLTGLTQMLKGLPMREETLLAAQGMNLSSGQRQLIVLTAAFASARPVLLLDEATSQVDAVSRTRIDWNKLRQGRTIVRVEHG
jgi:ABC-type bacteriocin/lantibiotic exporter with double-glycine peptidase domain